MNDCVENPLAEANKVQTDFLMLVGWQTLAVTETSSSYEVEALPLSQSSACPHCASPTVALRPCGTMRQSVRDAQVRQKHVRINFTRKRYHCKVCQRFSRQPLPGINERRKATDRLIELIGAEAFIKSFTMVSMETGSSPTQVRTIFKERVSKIAAMVTPETPRVLGLEEVFLRGKPRCILTDIERHRPLELLPKSDMLSLCGYLLYLPKRHGIEVVVMDFWRSRLEVVQRVLPKAAVVINKWAVLQVAQRAALRVLKNVRARSNDSSLLRPRYSLYLRVGYSSLSVEDLEALAELFEREPELREAYRLRQEFFNIWKFRDRQKAENQYEQWMKSITPELHYAFGDLLEMVNRWHLEVFNYFDHPFTNAYTESVVHKLRGLSSTSSVETARAKVLYGVYVLRTSTAPARKPHAQRIRLKKAKPKARRAPAPQKLAINDEKLMDDRESENE